MIFGEHFIPVILLLFLGSAAVALGLHAGIVLAGKLWGPVRVEVCHTRHARTEPT